MHNTGEEHESAFKQAQAKHRRRIDDPNWTGDYQEWVDFGRSLGSDKRIVEVSGATQREQLQGIYEGPIFGLKEYPGFIFCPQALDKDLQNELAFRSVFEYCESPHATNIDQCQPKQSETINTGQRMWDVWKDDTSKLDSRQKKQKTLHSVKRKYRSFKKLSWATLGYHYDWTERRYHERRKSDMPSLVANISNVFARTFLSLPCGAEANEVSFTPSAAIVNYYSTKSTMGGHRDDLEMALEKPIISISLGLPAIFLLGGKQKNDAPVLPVLIRPGDVLCMGGESRLNYHAMARVLPAAAQVPRSLDACGPRKHERVSMKTVHAQSSNIPPEDQRALETFLFLHRININVRQVYKEAL